MTARAASEDPAQLAGRHVEHVDLRRPAAAAGPAAAALGGTGGQGVMHDDPLRGGVCVAERYLGGVSAADSSARRGGWFCAACGLDVDLARAREHFDLCWAGDREPEPEPVDPIEEDE